LEGLALEDDGIFYGRLVHFKVFCYILGTFGKVCGNLVHFFPVLVFCTKKNLATPVTRCFTLSLIAADISRGLSLLQLNPD
jgi:hypothetical protein